MKKFRTVLFLLALIGCHRAPYLIVNPPLTPPEKQLNEQTALDISRAIQNFHMPYGTIVDPVFSLHASSQSVILGYERAADSTI